MPKKKINNKKGLALIIVVSILFTLTGISLIFVRLATTNRQGSSNFVLTQQAKMTAFSGIDYAICQLQQILTRTGYSDLQAIHQYLDEELLTPLKEIKKPSFHFQEPPKQNFQYSGSIAKDCFFTLKVRDANAFLSVNDPNPNWKSIFTHLLIKVLGYSKTLANQHAQDVQKEREKAFKRERKYEIAHLTTILPPQDYEKIFPFLISESWVNTNVVASNSILQQTNEVVAKSPININLAPPEIIESVLIGIKDNKGITTIGESLAKQLAEEIVVYRKDKGGIQTWSEMKDFLKEKLSASTQVELFIANSFSEAIVNDVEPDNFHLSNIDKFDLLTDSAEFCLGSMGFFKIECLGRIIQKETKQILAQKYMYANMNLCENIIHQSQQDFHKARSLVSDPGDAWTGPLAITPIAHFFNAHNSVGYLFRKNPSGMEPSKFWSRTISPRPDGSSAFFSALPDSDDPSELSFFFKISHAYQQENFIIYESDFPAKEAGQIRTFIQYKDGAIHISRVHGIEAPMRGTRVYPAYIFTASRAFRDKGKRLENAAARIYNDMIDQVSKTFKGKGKEAKKRAVPDSKSLDSFKEILAREVDITYGTGSVNKFGRNLEFKIRFRMEIKTDEGWKPDGTKNGTITISLNYPQNPASAKVPTAKGIKNLSLKAPAFWESIFQKEPKRLGPITRNSRADEGAVDIDNFLAEPLPFYEYSRYEVKLPVTLKKGNWYYLSVKWRNIKIEKVEIKGKDVDESNFIEIQENLGDPLHIWLFEQVNMGAQYHIPGTIYEAPNGSARYQNASFNGGFEIPDGDLYFASAFWSGFYQNNNDLSVALNIMGNSLTIPEEGTLKANVVKNILLSEKTLIFYNINLQQQNDFLTPFFHKITFRFIRSQPQYLYYFFE